MSASIEVDYITPKNAPYVTTNKVDITPAVTTFAVLVEGSGATVTASAYTVGNIVTVNISKFSSTVNSSGCSVSLHNHGLPTIGTKIERCPIMIYNETSLTWDCGYAQISNYLHDPNIAMRSVGLMSTTDTFDYGPYMINYSSA